MANTPNRHDILTGSQPDGRAFPAGQDMTCGNWTKSTQGSAMVGHHDRMAEATPNASARPSSARVGDEGAAHAQQDR